MMRKIGPPRAVVARELTDENIPLRDAWIGTLRDSRDISRIIGKIGKYLPIIPHLKRCSSKRLILAFATGNKNNETNQMKKLELKNGENDEMNYSHCDMKKLLINAGIDLSLFEKDIEIIKVPSVGARTKIQACAASKIWPLNFHPDSTIESIIDGTFFSNEQLVIIDRCMKICIDAVSIGDPRGTDECNGGAIIYDPKDNKIMSIAVSKINRNPMWHSAILAIDLIARIGNGGVYELLTNDEMKNINDDVKKNSIDGMKNFRKRKYPRKEKREAPLAYPEELVQLARQFNNDNDKKNHPLGDKNNDEIIYYSYLCTNYWVFLISEPCPMCAMALLHSRVSHIFYGIKNNYRGVLGSRAMLHTISGLNHRYRVWQGIRDEECQLIFNEISRRSSTYQ